jgi:hypothetical protein
MTPGGLLGGSPPGNSPGRVGRPPARTISISRPPARTISISVHQLGISQLGGEMLGNLSRGPDEQGLVELATPLTAKLVRALRLVGQAAENAGRAPLGADHLPDLGESGLERPVVGDDNHTHSRSRPPSLLQAVRQGRRPVAQPDHFSQASPGDQDDCFRLSQQVIEGPVPADPAAVRNDVGPRDPG